MEKPQLGIFAEFWDKNPNHLPFLNLIDAGNNDDWNLKKSIQLLTSIIDKNPIEQIMTDLKGLLRDPNWRPHLVASISTLMLPRKEKLEMSAELWKRVKLGSWASPQILAVLSIIDPEFRSTWPQTDPTYHDFEKTMIAYKSLSDETNLSPHFAIDWKNNALELCANGTIAETKTKN